MNHSGDRLRNRPWRNWRYWLLLFLVVAFLGIVTSMAMFSSWTEIKSATATEASAEFDATIAQIDDQRQYLTISESGVVDVQRELEQPAVSDLSALNVLAYEPGVTRLVRVRFPFWFVKLKTTNQLNLGTLISALSSDWEHINLNVTQDDLMHRGPGIVLDHKRLDGGRILLWSE